MSCKSCYKYPLCDKCEGFKNKRLSEEELEYRKELRRQVKEMLEDE